MREAATLSVWGGTHRDRDTARCRSTAAAAGQRPGRASRVDAFCLQRSCCPQSLDLFHFKTMNLKVIVELYAKSIARLSIDLACRRPYADHYATLACPPVTKDRRSAVDILLRLAELEENVLHRRHPDNESVRLRDERRPHGSADAVRNDCARRARKHQRRAQQGSGVHHRRFTTRWMRTTSPSAKTTTR